MDLYIKEWPDESVSIINRQGQTVEQYVNLDEAEDAAREWELTDSDLNPKFSTAASVDEPVFYLEW